MKIDYVNLYPRGASFQSAHPRPEARNAVLGGCDADAWSPGPPNTVAEDVRFAVAESKADWVVGLLTTDWFAPKHHPAMLASPYHWPPENAISEAESEGVNWSRGLLIPSEEPLEKILADLPPEVHAVGQLVFWVDTMDGMVSRAMTHEVRIVRPGAAFKVTPFGFFATEGITAFLTRQPLLRQPLSTLAYEVGDFKAAAEMAAAQKSKFDRRVFIKARAELEAQEAEAAFRVLFEHMSLSEELWRLREMMRYLPYTFEERVDDLRVLMQKQIGHLETPEGELAWYRDGSPAEIIDATYAKFTSPMYPTHRAKWLVDEARKHGYKRVVELGSVDGVNLFAYEYLAPEVEWHGVEANPKGKAHADKICAEIQRKPLNMHTASFEEFAGQTWASRQQFDAVAVFEVLEHNFDPDPVLTAAEMCVKPGGRVYITTPNGNWSAHDEPTRVLDLRKDHVCAYTVKRMRAMLEKRGAKDIECFAVENPTYEEGNSWCYASFKPGVE